MFHLIKFIIWLAGIAVVAYFALPYFGYEVNLNYYNERKGECQSRVTECSQQLIKQGTQNAKCDFNCVDPTLIIKKNNS